MLDLIPFQPTFETWIVVASLLWLAFLSILFVYLAVRDGRRKGK